MLTARAYTALPMFTVVTDAAPLSSSVGPSATLEIGDGSEGSEISTNWRPLSPCAATTA